MSVTSDPTSLKPYLLEDTNRTLPETKQKCSTKVTAPAAQYLNWAKNFEEPCASVLLWVSCVQSLEGKRVWGKRNFKVFTNKQLN